VEYYSLIGENRKRILLEIGFASVLFTSRMTRERFGITAALVPVTPCPASLPAITRPAIKPGASEGREVVESGKSDIASTHARRDRGYRGLFYRSATSISCTSSSTRSSRADRTVAFRQMGNKILFSAFLTTEALGRLGDSYTPKSENWSLTFYAPNHSDKTSYHAKTPSTQRRIITYFSEPWRLLRRCARHVFPISSSSENFEYLWLGF